MFAFDAWKMLKWMLVDFGRFLRLAKLVHQASSCFLVWLGQEVNTNPLYKAKRNGQAWLFIKVYGQGPPLRPGPCHAHVKRPWGANSSALLSGVA